MIISEGKTDPKAYSIFSDTDKCGFITKFSIKRTVACALNIKVHIIVEALIN
jgi:hypothetical protein